MRLIDADKLYIDAIDGSYYDNQDEDVFIDMIDRQETVYTVTEKHGKWEFAGDGVIVCSVCATDYCPKSVFPRNFCPNCGARMDVKNEPPTI